jgi:fatty-acyl-CoA synthase
VRIHGDLLGERARLTPEREALVLADGSRRLTYGELDSGAARAALALARDFRLRKAERVGILAHNCVEFVEVFFACAKSGVIAVPLSTRSTVHELEGIIRDSGLRALVYGRGFAAQAASVRDLCGLDAIAGLDPHDLAAGSPAWNELTSAHDPADARFEPAGPEEICALLYTSGTTGKPKGVMISHRMLTWNAYNTVLNWGLREDDRGPVFTPMYHAGGLTVFLTPLFAAGGAIILHERFEASEVWRAIERERCSVVFAVPTIWKFMMEAPEFATADLEHVRWFVSGGAPLPTFIIEAYRRRGIVMRQGFGMTEAGVNCFSMSSDDAIRKPGSIGLPMLFTEARLVKDDGSACAPGEVGELQFRGPHVSSGYWQNAEATRASFLEDGWFRSGDSARRDDEGFFYVAGRKKEMFISGGVNVYPAEIEAELVQHPHIADAAVIGIEDATWGEVGAAFVVATAAATLDIPSIESWLGERLSRLKIPKRWEILSELPRNPYGKIEKTKLRDSLIVDR